MISQFEAIPESLKNMLLVMSTAGIFEQSCGDGEDGRPISEADKQRKYSALWQVSVILRFVLTVLSSS